MNALLMVYFSVGMSFAGLGLLKLQARLEQWAYDRHAEDWSAPSIDARGRKGSGADSELCPLPAFSEADASAQRSGQILRNVRTAAGPPIHGAAGGIGHPQTTTVTSPEKWVDLETLLNLGVRERTAAEYRNLLSQAGFQMTRVVQTALPPSVVKAQAA
jgi:hypothetical protein